MRFRRVLAVVFAAVAIIVPTSAFSSAPHPTPSATAVAHAPRVNDVTGNLCADFGQGLCLQLDTNSGQTCNFTGVGETPCFQVDTVNNSNTITQNIGRGSDTYCSGGVVTSSCPFDTGSTDNSETQGDQLVQLYFNDYNPQQCVGAYENPGQNFYGYESACTGGSGNLFVRVPTTTGTYEYINVLSTNTFYEENTSQNKGLLVLMASNGTSGGQVQFKPCCYQTENVSWTFESS